MRTVARFRNIFVEMLNAEILISLLCLSRILYNCTNDGASFNCAKLKVAAHASRARNVLYPNEGAIDITCCVISTIKLYVHFNRLSLSLYLFVSSSTFLSFFIAFIVCIAI